MPRAARGGRTSATPVARRAALPAPCPRPTPRRGQSAPARQSPERTPPSTPGRSRVERPSPRGTIVTSGPPAATGRRSGRLALALVVDLEDLAGSVPGDLHEVAGHGDRLLLRLHV